MTNDSKYEPAPPDELEVRLASLGGRSPRPPVAVHLGGVWWYQAAAPPKRHACWAQTKGNAGSLDDVSRCACGGVSLDGGPWFNRYERVAEPSSVAPFARRFWDLLVGRDPRG